MPLVAGRLAVSRSHAVFCPVDEQHVASLEAAMAGEEAASLPPALHARLSEHGFFGPPRPEQPDPPTVQLQLTNACNLACSYCCTDSGRRRPEEIGFEGFARVLREAREALGPEARVALLGGEPLLVSFAVELGELALSLGLHLTLFTNGLPLRKEPVSAHVAALVARGAEVRVSLSGVTPELCDAEAGADRFHSAVEGLHCLAGHGAKAVVDLMLLPHHVDAAAEHLPELRRRLPPGTRISFGVAFVGGRERGANVFPSRSALEAALDRITFEAGETVRAPRRSPLAWRRVGCGCALGRHLHVRSDGALFTCFRMLEPVGTLDDGFGATAGRLRTELAAPEAAPGCARCALFTLCGGGCRSDNVVTCGGPAPACGPWRVRVLSELLAEGWVGAVEWPTHHLLAEAHARGIEGPTGYPESTPQPTTEDEA